MQIHRGKAPGSGRLARTGVELSREGRVRLAWMDFYRGSGNVARTCRRFGISRQTFYRWQRRYDPLDLTSLEGRSHRPHHRRQPTWTFLLSEKVLTLRLQFPRWGKDKLAVLLRQQKISISTSMLGRILTWLKRQGRLVEPPRPGVPGSRRALRPRPYAVRKPRQYAVSIPGDLVEVDTVEVRPIPGVVFKQFTARDVVSRWDVIQAHPRATAQAATQFLDTLQHRMPFPIRAVQVDGGSEFAADFEQACQQRGLHLFVLPPRSPKLNGAVERANRTHTEEFYQVTPFSLEMNQLNLDLRRWEKIYNTVRPHQSLGYLTPQQFLLQSSSQRKE
ncbi:MAG: integrase core domain-containing protein [Terriglobales bacterium]